jgi:hypothetical protein
MVHLLPTNLSVNVTGSQQREIQFQRQNGDLNKPYVPNRDLTTRTGNMAWSTGLRPIDAISYTFDQGRDLRLSAAPRQILGLRIGTEVSRRHQLTANQQVRLFKGSVVPKVAWTGSFDGRFNSLQTGSAVSELTNSFNNSSTLTFSGSVPTDILFRKFTSGIHRGEGSPGKGDSGKGGSGKSDSGKSDSGKNDSGSGDEIVNPGDLENPEQPDTSGNQPQRTPPPPPREEGGGEGGIANLLTIGPLIASYTIGSTSSLGLITGDPSIPYQLGLSRNAGSHVRPLSDFSPNRSIGDRKDLNLSSSLKILSEITVRTTFQQSDTKSSTNGGGTTTRLRHFPDFDIDWGRIHRRLGLQRLTKDLKASTHYTKEVRDTGTSTAPKDHSQTTISFRPLLNLDATLNDGISSRLTSAYTSSRDEQFGVTHNLTLSRTRSIELSMKRTLNLNRMVTNPLTKKKSKVSSKLDMSVTVDLSDDRTASGSVDNLIVLQDHAKFALSTTGGYNITQNVTGNAGITFGQDSDRKNKTKTARYISVSVSAAFNF